MHLPSAPSSAAAAVNDYLYSERHDCAKYENRQPFDSSGVWSLHALAREIYALGWRDGSEYATEQARGVATAEAQRDYDATLAVTDTEAPEL